MYAINFSYHYGESCTTLRDNFVAIKVLKMKLSGQAVKGDKPLVGELRFNISRAQSTQL